MRGSRSRIFWRSDLNLAATIWLGTALAAAALVSGCEGSVGVGVDATAADAASDDGAGPGDAGPDLATAGCRPGAGATGAPGSISEAVELANSLPRPVSLACFLESLTRPLYAVATSNIVSLQPAVGSRSPRVLLVSDRLIMTLVPAGTGSHTIELGEFVTALRTLKAELGFPLVQALAPPDPFERIRDPRGGTTCRGCHRDEAPVEEIGYAMAFTSGAIRPHFRNQVELESLRAERDRCDDAIEPDRCAILRALFDHGPVLPRDLPASVPTIFD